ncbi:hypothetical protein KI387_039903, partial [Taxus chinensis]
IDLVTVCEEVVKSSFTGGWTRLGIGKAPNVVVGLGVGEGLGVDEGLGIGGGWGEGMNDEERVDMTSLG